jgi:hypothetical protein
MNSNVIAPVKIGDFYLSQTKGTFAIIQGNNRKDFLPLIMDSLLHDEMVSFVASNTKNAMSCLESEADVSMIVELDQKNQTIFFDNLANDYYGKCEFEKKLYYCLEIWTEIPGERNSVGLLEKVTHFFAENEIPIICQSTFSYNYIYYQIDEDVKLREAIKREFIL